MTRTSVPVLRSTLLVIAVVAMLAVLTILRFVFWGVFKSGSDPVAMPVLARAFYLGLKFDLRLVLLMLVPFAVLGTVRPLDPTRSRAARRFWVNHLSLLTVLTVALYAIDLGNYAYLGERLDASALRYLENPAISFTMVWETYPIVWGVLGLAIFGAVFRRALGALWPQPATEEARRPKARWPRWRRAMVGSVVLVAYLGGIYGKLSYYPLRWSDAFFTTQRFVSDLALNPVLFFANTLATAERELAYDVDEFESRYDIVAHYLGVEERDREDFGLGRYVRPRAVGSRPLNVVLIFGESFATHKTGTFGNPLDPSPNFDAFAADALLYTNFYSPRLGTARGVFATLTGIPDTITYRTASRNPRTIRNHTILRSFEGYEKFYFLGGSANWANVRALFSHNHDDVRIYEEGSFVSARVDVWGISDYFLLEEANRVLAEVGDSPFFAFIHLAGNHRPFTIPDNIPGFEVRQVGDDALRRGGFESLAEFNAFRLQDYSIGHYLEIARKEDYFHDTLIVILSDNGGSGRSSQRPTCEEQLGLGLYHAPLAFYAPRVIPEGAVVDTPASQLDVLPTVAALAGVPALNTTLGRNLLDPRFADDGVAFIYRKRGSAAEIGLVGRDEVLLVEAGGADAKLHACPSAGPLHDVTASMPEHTEAMKGIALGLYHASKYLMYHNAPERYDALGLARVRRVPLPGEAPGRVQGTLAGSP